MRARLLIAGAVVLSFGVGAAQPVAHASVRTPAHPVRPAHTAAVTTHAEKFTLESIGGATSVIASGYFAAGGRDHRTKNDLFELLHGKIRMVRGKKIHHHQTLNQTTCAYKASIHGTFKVRGVSGAYKAITGHGTYRGTSIAVLGRNPKTGKCDFKVKQQAYQQVVHAKARVKGTVGASGRN